MSRLIGGLVSLLVIVSCVAGPSQDSGLADVDLVLYNGVIHTMDEHRTIAEAIAISGNRITKVGGNKEVLQLASAQTTTVDLDGRMVLPGLVDSHAHIGIGGDYAAACTLHSAADKADLLRLMERCADDHTRGGLLWGFGFNPAEVGPVEITRAELDEVFPDRPVALVTIQDDYTFINSAALAHMGYGTRDGDLTREDIVRDEKGEPTGRLLGILALSRLGLFEGTDEEEALVGEVRKLNSLGLTSFWDAGVFVPDWAGRLRVFKALDDRGELTVRANLSIIPQLGEVLKASGVLVEEPGSWKQRIQKILALRDELASDRIRLETLKVFCDGYPYLLEPYEGTDFRGELMMPHEQMVELIETGAQMGFSTHTHTIGDGAARSALDALAATGGPRSADGPRHTLSHLTLVHPEDLHRFKALDVVANVSPVWAHVGSVNQLAGDPGSAGGALGDRAARVLPFKDLVDHGAVLSSSSDYPYGSLNPFEGIEIAMTRQHPERYSDPLNPDQSLPLGTMIASYTVNGAYQLGQENVIGSLEAGKLADLVVLNQNLYEVDTYEISETEVLLTVFDGEIVFGSPETLGLPDAAHVESDQ